MFRIKDDINFTWITFMIIMWIINSTLRNLNLKYLEDKASGQQSLMDSAHGFVIRSAARLARLNVIACMIMRILDFDQDHAIVILTILDILLLWFAYIFFASVLIDVLLQFVLVMKPDSVWDLKWEDWKIEKATTLAVGSIMLVISTTLSAFGDRSPMYYSYLKIEHGFNVLEIFRNIYIVTCMSTCTILRIILKIAPKQTDFGTNQIFSNKVFICFLILHAPYEILRKAVPPPYYSYVFELHVFGATTLSLFNTILFHGDLFKFAFKRIFQFDVIRTLLPIFQGINFAFNLLLNQLTTMESLE